MFCLYGAIEQKNSLGGFRSIACQYKFYDVWKQFVDLEAKYKKLNVDVAVKKRKLEKEEQQQERKLEEEKQKQERKLEEEKQKQERKLKEEKQNQDDQGPEGQGNEGAAQVKIEDNGNDRQGNQDGDVSRRETPEEELARLRRVLKVIKDVVKDV